MWFYSHGELMPQLGCAFAPARVREGGRHYKIVVKCKEKVASATTQATLAPPPPLPRVELTLLQVHFIQIRLQVQRVYFFFCPGFALAWQILRRLPRTFAPRLPRAPCPGHSCRLICMSPVIFRAWAELRNWTANIETAFCCCGF